MTNDIPPALSPAQWAAVLQRAEDLVALRAGFGNTPFSSHALAALFLLDQPFGFDQSDVVDESEVADYCDVMAAQNTAAGDPAKAAKFAELAVRHRRRAEKIAALLPPPGLTIEES